MTKGVLKLKGNGFIKLRIAGQNLNFEEITQKLSQQPSFIYRKGDCYTPKFGDKQPIIYEEDCWIFEVEKQEDETFDDMLYAFLIRFIKSKEYIKELSDNFDATLWVSVYPDGEQSNIHLEKKTLKILSDMGLVVDLDIMFLKDFYDGTYSK